MRCRDCKGKITVGHMPDENKEEYLCDVCIQKYVELSEREEASFKERGVPLIKEIEPFD